MLTMPQDRVCVRFHIPTSSCIHTQIKVAQPHSDVASYFGGSFERGRGFKWIQLCFTYFSFLNPLLFHRFFFFSLKSRERTKLNIMIMDICIHICERERKYEITRAVYEYKQLCRNKYDNRINQSGTIYTAVAMVDLIKERKVFSYIYR